MATPKYTCSFCGGPAKTLHQLDLPRGIHLACGNCLDTIFAECKSIKGDS